MTTQAQAQYLHFQYANACYPIQDGQADTLANALIAALQDGKNDVFTVNCIADHLELGDPVVRRMAKMIIARTLTLPPSAQNFTELRITKDLKEGFVITPEAKRINGTPLKAFVINNSKDKYEEWF